MTDLATAAWLRSDGLRAVASNAAAAPWGGAAVETEARCAFDTAAAAQAEAARQIAFLGPARVLETLRVEGRQVDLIGCCINLTAPVEGYRTGADVFVIGAEELQEDDATSLKVIRRLA